MKNDALDLTESKYDQRLLLLMQWHNIGTEILKIRSLRKGRFFMIRKFVIYLTNIKLYVTINLVRSTSCFSSRKRELLFFIFLL